MATQSNAPGPESSDGFRLVSFGIAGPLKDVTPLAPFVGMVLAATIQRIVYCAPMDRTGYIDTHNSKYP